jgi:RNA ligase
LKEKYSTYDFDEDYTFLFELIAPENRIVVDYGETRDLFLLGAIHRETGVEAQYELLQEYSILMGVPLMKKYSFQNFSELLEQVDRQAFQNEEGYVVKFNTGLRVKVKFNEYKRIHRLTYQFNDGYLWELLRTDQDLTEVYKNIPDTYVRPIQERALAFIEEYKAIESDVCAMVEKLAHLPRKEFALSIQDYEYRSVCFAMINEKDYKQIIWKILKP